MFLNQIFAREARLLGRLFIFYKPACFTEVFSRTSTIHPGIFRGRALWTDSVAPRKNTIASRDRIKPIIGGNLVVNYKG